MAYKFCSLEHAHLIECGDLKVGTLRGYASLESSRADAEEGTAAWEIDTAHLEHNSQDPAVRDFMRHQRLFKLGPFSSITLKNITFVEETPDLNCFCMSLDIDARPKDDGEQAVFRVGNGSGLATALRRKLSPAIVSSKFGRVHYGPRRATFAAGIGMRASPFLKPIEFAWEQEIRIILFPNDPKAVTVVHTGADPYLASFFERLA